MRVLFLIYEDMTTNHCYHLSIKVLENRMHGVWGSLNKNK